MKILVTGAAGFVARNLIVRLEELPGFEVVRFAREMSDSDLPVLLRVDAVVHWRVSIRPQSPDEFATGNARAPPTQRPRDALLATGRALPLILSSSSQAALDNPYGRSKRAAEEIVRARPSVRCRHTFIL